MRQYGKFFDAYHSFKKIRKVVLLGDFNGMVGRFVLIDDMTDIFMENMCNACRNRLISILNEIQLMICNREICLSLSEQRISPNLKQNSVYSRLYVL